MKARAADAMRYGHSRALEAMERRRGGDGVELRHQVARGRELELLLLLRQVRPADGREELLLDAPLLGGKLLYHTQCTAGSVPNNAHCTGECVPCVRRWQTPWRRATASYPSGR